MIAAVQIATCLFRLSRLKIFSKAPRKKNSSVTPAVKAITNRHASQFPFNIRLVTFAILSSCAFIHASIGARKSGKVSMLLSSAVRLMVGEMSIHAAIACMYGLTDWYVPFVEANRNFLGSELHNHAVPMAGRSMVQTLDKNWTERSMATLSFNAVTDTPQTIATTIISKDATTYPAKKSATKTNKGTYAPEFVKQDFSFIDF